VRVAAAVAAGAALGAMARHAVSLALLAGPGAGLAYGTLAANGLGSFLIGLYAALAGPAGRYVASPAQQAFVMTGFCGGFTTFSIFSLEALLLAQAGAWASAAGFVAGSAVVWAAAIAAGHGLGRRLGRRGGGTG
jgi:fluoride exporter